MRIVRVVLGGLAVLAAAVAYSWMSLPDVRVLQKQNPRSTAFMERRAREAAANGKPWRPSWRWTSYSRISPALKRAVIVSEDAAFWGHDGLDLDELRVALADSIRRGVAPRGASTITQQLAKNLYLSPSYSPHRKLVELMIARRLEAELSKVRIFELYLNVIEWGDGIWGAEAASRRYFGKSASDLSTEEAALLAGAIINPRVYSPTRPNQRLLRRQQIILGRLGIGSAPAGTLDESPDAAEVSGEPLAGQ